MQFGQCLKGQDVNEFDNKTLRFCSFPSPDCSNPNPEFCSVILLNSCQKTAKGQSYKATVTFTPDATKPASASFAVLSLAVALIATALHA